MQLTVHRLKIIVSAYGAGSVCQVARGEDCCADVAMLRVQPEPFDLVAPDIYGALALPTRLGPAC